MQETTVRLSGSRVMTAPLAAAGAAAGLVKRRGPKTPELVLLDRPPLKLVRPLSLFGDLPVSMSSSLALGPDTVLRVTTGAGMVDWLRKAAPGYVALMRKLMYVARKEHALSPGLRKLALTEFAPFNSVLPRGELEKSLDDPDYTIAGPNSPWALALGGLQADGNMRLDDTLVRICQWMQACDAHGFYVENLMLAGRNAEAESHVASLLGQARGAWIKLNPRLAMSAFCAIEVPLMAIAKLEFEWAAAETKVGEAVRSSAILDRKSVV